MQYLVTGSSRRANYNGREPFDDIRLHLRGHFAYDLMGFAECVGEAERSPRLESNGWNA